MKPLLWSSTLAQLRQFLRCSDWLDGNFCSDDSYEVDFPEDTICVSASSTCFSVCCPDDPGSSNNPGSPSVSNISQTAATFNNMTSTKDTNNWDIGITDPSNAFFPMRSGKLCPKRNEILQESDCNSAADDLKSDYLEIKFRTVLSRDKRWKNHPLCFMLFVPDSKEVFVYFNPMTISDYRFTEETRSICQHQRDVTCATLRSAKKFFCKNLQWKEPLTGSCPANSDCTIFCCKRPGSPLDCFDINAAACIRMGKGVCDNENIKNACPRFCGVCDGSAFDPCDTAITIQCWRNILQIKDKCKVKCSEQLKPEFLRSPMMQKELKRSDNEEDEFNRDDPFAETYPEYTLTQMCETVTKEQCERNAFGFYDLCSLRCAAITGKVCLADEFCGPGGRCTCPAGYFCDQSAVVCKQVMHFSEQVGRTRSTRSTKELMGLERVGLIPDPRLPDATLVRKSMRSGGIRRLKMKTAYCTLETETSKCEHYEICAYKETFDELCPTEIPLRTDDLNEPDEYCQCIPKVAKKASNAEPTAKAHSNSADGQPPPVSANPSEDCSMTTHKLCSNGKCVLIGESCDKDKKVEEDSDGEHGSSGTDEGIDQAKIDDHVCLPEGWSGLSCTDLAVDNLCDTEAFLDGGKKVKDCCQKSCASALTTDKKNNKKEKKDDESCLPQYWKGISCQILASDDLCDHDADDGKKIKDCCRLSCNPEPRQQALGTDCKKSEQCSTNFCKNGKCDKKSKNAQCNHSKECSSEVCTKNLCKGFANGTSCIKSDECISNFCEEKKCQRKEDSTSCKNALECVSNFCNEEGICDKKQAGTKCSSPTDCASKVCENGICTKRADGKPCEQSNECVSNYCRANKCDRKDDGSHCVASTECHARNCYDGRCTRKEDGLSCILPTDCKTKLCQNGKCTRKAEGKDCESARECASKFCNTETSICEKKKDDADCAEDIECTSNFCENGTCTRKMDGTSCENPEECKTNFCNTKRKCESKELNEACVDDRSCRTKNCHEGKCKRKIDNQSCQEDIECKSRFCSGEKCVRKADFAFCDESTECISKNCEKKMCSRKKDGTSCVAPTECISTVCQNGKCSRKADGKSCEVSTECVSHYCNKNNLCETLVDGEQCEVSEQCFSKFCHQKVCQGKEDGAKCSATLECQTKFCDSGSCSRKADGNSCKLSHECVSNLCKGKKCERKPEGIACHMSEECISNFCNDSECTKKADEDPCGGSKECKSNFCRDRRCTRKGNGAKCENFEECKTNYCSPAKKCANKDDGARCIINTECISQFCQKGKCQRKRDGEKCSKKVECISNYCYNRECAQKDDNASCNESKECVSDLCHRKKCIRKASGIKCRKDNECISGECTKSRCEKTLKEKCESTPECESLSFTIVATKCKHKKFQQECFKRCMPRLCANLLVENDMYNIPISPRKKCTDKSTKCKLIRRLHKVKRHCKNKSFAAACPKLCKLCTCEDSHQQYCKNFTGRRLKDACTKKKFRDKCMKSCHACGKGRILNTSSTDDEMMSDPVISSRRALHEPAPRPTLSWQKKHGDSRPFDYGVLLQHMEQLSRQLSHDHNERKSSDNTRNLKAPSTEVYMNPKPIDTVPYNKKRYRAPISQPDSIRQLHTNYTDMETMDSENSDEDDRRNLKIDFNKDIPKNQRILKKRMEDLVTVLSQKIAFGENVAITKR